MKRRRFLFWCFAVAAIAGALVVWHSGRVEIPITLVGYTNDVTGIPTTSYATSNLAHSGFAMFRVHNPTRDSFLCYIGPLTVGTTKIQPRETQVGDFELSPGAAVTFAVPAPETRDAWRCGVVLYRKRHLSRWKYEVFRFAKRWGLYDYEKPLYAGGPEIVR